MAQLPTSQVTQGQIVDRALKRAGNTKIKALARARLFQILDDLALEYDWPQLIKNVAVTISTDTFSLPTDFLSTPDDDGLTLTSVNGFVVKQPVGQRDRQTFERSRIGSAVTSGTTPRLWTVDYEQGVGIVWPPPSSAVTATLRYKYRPVQVDPDANGGMDFADAFAWFPYTTYLIDALYAWALEYDENGDATTALLKAEQRLDRIRQVAIPTRAQRMDIPLDDEVFTTPYRSSHGRSEW